MNSFMSKGAMMLFACALCAGMVSCKESDPNAGDFVTPTVTVQPNTLRGIISAKSGQAIAGATVSLDGKMVKTNADGMFFFDNVVAGTHQISATAEGKVTVAESIVVVDLKKTQNLTWNAMLASVVKSDNVIVIEQAKQEEVLMDTVRTETLVNNDEAIIQMAAVVPAAALEVVSTPSQPAVEKVTISLTPIYSEDQAMNAVRATTQQESMLAGAVLSTSNENVKLTKPVEISLLVEDAVAASVEPKMLKNGAWVPVNSRNEAGKIVVLAEEFTAYGLFANVTVTTEKMTQQVKFDQSVWDNSYGASDMTAKEAKYSYLMGTETKVSAPVQLAALLKEKLATNMGHGVKSVNTAYQMSVKLPVGSKLEVKGAQEVETVKASVGESYATATSYGAVQVEAHTSSRIHTGSSN